MTMSVTIGRVDEDDDLVIGGEAPADGDGFFIGFGGLFEPSFDVRATHAPDSAWVAGSQLTSVVLAQSTLPLVIVAVSTSTSGLATLKAELAAAVWQFTYTITLTVDGVDQSWQAEPTWPQWGELTSAMTGQCMARAAVVIPVNPGG